MLRGEHGNVTVLSGSISSFVLSLLLSHANTKKKNDFSIFFPCFSFLLIPLYSPIYCPLSSLLFPPSVLSVRRARVRVSSLCAAKEHHQGRLPAWQRGGQLLQGTLSVQDWCHPGGTQERETSAHPRTQDIAFNDVTCYWQLSIDTGVTTGSSLKGQCGQKSALQGLVVVIKLQSPFWV